jgi:hypothetical protein
MFHIGFGLGIDFLMNLLSNNEKLLNMLSYSSVNQLSDINTNVKTI